VGLWRPPQWQNSSPAKVIINFPGQPAAGQFSSAAGSTVVLPSSPTLYAFDADFAIDHEQQLRRTEHPVQTGASISDHAFIVPARLSMDIGMSDLIDAYYSPSTWQGSPSKSVSAYQTMLALMFSRIPFSITTRLRTYQNMIVENLAPREHVKTSHGLRMRIEFGQIFVANITTIPASARPQETVNTNQGSVNAENPTPTQVSQNSITGMGVPASSNSIGAGSQSSVNTNNLPAAVGK
jgi:hypothetical protein